MLAGLSALAIAVFLANAFLRAPLPLELDPIEGVTMDHVVRLAEGKPIYVEPSLEFIPLPAMPGFPALASLPARLFGPQLWQPRLLAFMAVLLTAFLLHRAVRIETESKLLALGATGVLLGSFAAAGTLSDVARPDSLMLALVFSGLMLLRLAHGVGGAIGAAGLMALAFFVHPHAAWFAIAALIHLAVGDARRLAPYGLTLLLLGGGGYVVLARWLGPWFTFFTWEVASLGAQVSAERLLAYVSVLVGKFALLVLAGLLSLALPIQLWRGRSGIWMWAAAGGVAAGLASTLNPEGSQPALHLALPWLCLVGPIALLKMVNHLAAWPGSERPGRSGVLYAAMLLQFVPLAHGVREHLPRPRDHEAHAELLNRLRAYPGPVLMVYHGHYAWQAGKGTMMQQAALDGILRARGNRLLTQDSLYFERMFQALEEGSQRPMIVTDVELEKTGIESRPLWEAVAGHYRLEAELGWNADSLSPGPGAGAKRWLFYVPLEPRTELLDPETGEPVAAVADNETPVQ